VASSAGKVTGDKIGRRHSGEAAGVLSRFLCPAAGSHSSGPAHCCTASDLPGVQRGGPPLLPIGLAPRGVSLPAELLLPRCALTHHFTLPHLAASGIFSVAFPYPIARTPALAGTLPCGDRTFLPPGPKEHSGSDWPVRQPHVIIVRMIGTGIFSRGGRRAWPA